MRVQVFYLVFLWVLSVLELLMSLVNVFEFGFWNQVFGTSSIMCRIFGQILIMV